MSLSPLPPAPDGVRYALTVPQSVLFADISLLGSCRPAFEKVFGADYELGYIAIDDGAMSWDYTGDHAFSEALLGTTDAVAGARRFIAAMGATSRAVEKTSWLLSAPSNRQRGDRGDLLDDLREYWDAYQRHMTSLFTFWNVEELLSEALIEALKDIGRDEEVQGGLQRFLQPSETNYFALERRHFARVAARFGSEGGSDGGAGLQSALADHVDNFGFLLAPFNLGTPPSVTSLQERLEEEVRADASRDGLMDLRPDMLDDLPGRVRELGLLAQELTFWKTERLDVMSLGDARAASMYRAAAEALSIDTDHLFSMRREEIDRSLVEGAPVVDERTRQGRLEGFCLVLRQGAIDFHLPSHASAEPSVDGDGAGSANELRGTAAAPGTVSGRVRRIIDLADIARLEPGDVLVTTMTRPEMGVALDRAGAFVTDEGGRMSHAAIIAREMGKPCVIGTGEATKLLRDGMLVTVDADAGIVTILPDSEGEGT